MRLLRGVPRAGLLDRVRLSDAELSTLDLEQILLDIPTQIESNFVQSVSKAALHKSTPPQIRQHIIPFYSYNERAGVRLLRGVPRAGLLDRVRRRRWQVMTLSLLSQSCLYFLSQSSIFSLSRLFSLSVRGQDCSIECDGGAGRLCASLFSLSYEPLFALLVMSLSSLS